MTYTEFLNSKVCVAPDSGFEEDEEMGIEMSM